MTNYKIDIRNHQVSVIAIGGDVLSQEHMGDITDMVLTVASHSAETLSASNCKMIDDEFTDNPLIKETLAELFSDYINVITDRPKVTLEINLK